MVNEAKLKGMGSTLGAHGVAFRVWAPHAQKVSVIGSFNDWDGTKHPMQGEENGYWCAQRGRGSRGRSISVPPDHAQGGVQAN